MSWMERGSKVMAAWRRAIELSLGDADSEKLRSIAQSQTEPVQRCVERAVAEGPLAALDDRPRPGRAPTITLEAKEVGQMRQRVAG
jgi:hypothetical protein